MNYMAHLKGYQIERKKTPISTNAIALYYILMEYNNDLGWIKWFTVPNSTLQGLTGLEIKALQRTRNELIQKKYIEYKKGTGNQAGSYLIARYDLQTVQQCDLQDDLQSVPQMSNRVTNNVTTLNKLNQTKTKDKSSTNVLPKESPVPYQEIMGLFNSICKSYGEIRSISGKRKEMVSARWKQFGNLKAFEDAFTNAEQSRFMQGENDRNWKADFDWIIKPSNFQKVLEGNYANREKPEDKRKYPDTSYNLAELEERLMSGTLEYD